MTFSRRDFIKTAGISLGAVTLPSWVYDPHLHAGFCILSDVDYEVNPNPDLVAMGSPSNS